MRNGTDDDGDLWVVLEVIANDGGFHSEMPDVEGLSRTAAYAIVDDLAERRWITAVRNHGDDQLLAVRNLRVTEAGASALKAAVKRPRRQRGQPMTTPLDQKRADRLQYMSALYDRTDGSTRAIVDMDDLGGQLGWDRDRTSRTFEYLEAEGLAESVALGGAIGITHRGVVEVEESRIAPEQPTQHFPAQSTVNNININTMVGSQINQGSPGSSQSNQIIEGAKLQEISDLVRQLRAEVLPALDLDEDARAELEVELGTAEHQLESGRPKASYVESALARIGEILAGAKVISGSLVELAPVLLKLHEVLPLV